jgi:hypothetical protein
MKKILLIAALFCLTGFINELKAQSDDGIIYRYYNPTIKRHFYTTSIDELGATGSQGYVREANLGRILTNGSPTIAIYRFYNSATYAHYYTKNINSYPSGFHYEGVIGYEPGLVFANLRDVYQFHFNNGDYFYSIDPTTPPGYTNDGFVFRILAY